jgi:hypothetical protein
MRGVRGVLVSFVLFPLAVCASPFGPREISKTKCSSLLKSAYRFLFFPNFRTPSELTREIVRQNSHLQNTEAFQKQVRRVIQRESEIFTDLDPVLMAKNYTHVQSNEEFIRLLQGTTDFFEHLYGHDQVLSPDFATKMIHEYGIAEYAELLELQFLFRNAGYTFGLLKGANVTRFRGGPSMVDPYNHPVFKLSPKIASQIPAFLIPAAVLWHWELLRLVNAKDSIASNQFKIGKWLLEESRGVVSTTKADIQEISPASIFITADPLHAILKNNLKEGLIENTLLRKLVELYRRTNQVHELDIYRTALFDEWALLPDSQLDDEIGKMVGADYGIPLHVMDLTSARAHLEIILSDAEGITADRLRTDQNIRIRAPVARSLLARIAGFFSRGSSKAISDIPPHEL